MRIVNHSISKNHSYLTRGKVYESTYLSSTETMFKMEIADDDGDDILIFIDMLNETECPHAKNTDWEIVE
jgi:hypothetical protein